MPATSEPLYLGALYAHCHGKPAQVLAMVYAMPADSSWAYMAQSPAETRNGSDLQLLLETVAGASGLPWYSLSIERTFFPPEKVPKGRKIVTHTAV